MFAALCAESGVNDTTGEGARFAEGAHRYYNRVRRTVDPLTHGTNKRPPYTVLANVYDPYEVNMSLREVHDDVRELGMEHLRVVDLLQFAAARPDIVERYAMVLAFGDSWVTSRGSIAIPCVSTRSGSMVLRVETALTCRKEFGIMDPQYRVFLTGVPEHIVAGRGGFNG